LPAAHGKSFAIKRNHDAVGQRVDIAAVRAFDFAVEAFGV
jgi:hypothetical protein